MVKLTTLIINLFISFYSLNICSINAIIIQLTVYKSRIFILFIYKVDYLQLLISLFFFLNNSSFIIQLVSNSFIARILFFLSLSSFFPSALIGLKVRACACSYSLLFGWLFYWDELWSWENLHHFTSYLWLTGCFSLSISSPSGLHLHSHNPSSRYLRRMPSSFSSYLSGASYILPRPLLPLPATIFITKQLVPDSWPPLPSELCLLSSTLFSPSFHFCTHRPHNWHTVLKSSLLSPVK